MCRSVLCRDPRRSTPEEEHVYSFMYHSDSLRSARSDMSSRYRKQNIALLTERTSILHNRLSTFCSSGARSKDNAGDTRLNVPNTKSPTRQCGDQFKSFLQNGATKSPARALILRNHRFTSSVQFSITVIGVYAPSATRLFRMKRLPS